MKNCMGSFTRKIDENYDSHDDYSSKSTKGGEGRMPFEFVSYSLK